MAHARPRITPEVAHLGCPEPRLVWNRAETIDELGGGYGLTMPGAVGAVFLSDYRTATFAALRDTYTVSPYNRVRVRVHMDCGMLKVASGPGGEHEGMYDPLDEGQMHALADAGAIEVRAYLDDMGIKAPVTSEVVDIRQDSDKIVGFPVPRPARIIPLDSSFYRRYGRYLQPLAA
jgi:hypothetical protein